MIDQFLLAQNADIPHLLTDLTARDRQHPTSTAGWGAMGCQRSLASRASAAAITLAAAPGLYGVLSTS